VAVLLNASEEVFEEVTDEFGKCSQCNDADDEGGVGFAHYQKEDEDEAVQEESQG